MKPLTVALALLVIGPGCTAVHESLMPHRALKSPCACLEDAAPVNDPALLESLGAEAV